MKYAHEIRPWNYPIALNINRPVYLRDTFIVITTAYVLVLFSNMVVYVLLCR